MLFLPAALPSSRASSWGFASAGGGANDDDASALDGSAGGGGPALQAQEARTPATVQAETAAMVVSFSARVSDMVLSTPLASEATETGTTPALATGSAANRPAARA